ncbi:MAG: hypothetical protein E3K37_04690 [Candidatus Kuenenia sp.]|nr:hypothetical protein [Candidatus Kuenenia hertensis]
MAIITAIDRKTAIRHFPELWKDRIIKRRLNNPAISRRYSSRIRRNGQNSSAITIKKINASMQ